MNRKQRSPQSPARVARPSAAARTARSFPSTLPSAVFSAAAGSISRELFAISPSERNSSTKQQEANERLRSVVDYVVDGIVTIDESGIVASWNRSAERIFGYTERGDDRPERLPIDARAPPQPPRLPSRQLPPNGHRETSSATSARWSQRGKTARSFRSTSPSANSCCRANASSPASFATSPSANGPTNGPNSWSSATALLTSVVDSASLLSRVARLPVPVLCRLVHRRSVRSRRTAWPRSLAVAHQRPRSKRPILQAAQKTTPLRRLARDRSWAQSCGRANPPAWPVDAINPFEYAEPSKPEDRELLLAARSAIADLRPAGHASPDLRGDHVRALRHEPRNTARPTWRWPRTSPSGLRSRSKTPDFTKRPRRPTAAKTNSSRRLAHELRNPLAPVRNALEIVRTRGHRRKVAWQSDSAVIDRQVDHMVRLVDDLLDLSRLMRGKIQLRPERLLLERRRRPARSKRPAR